MSRTPSSGRPPPTGPRRPPSADGRELAAVLVGLAGFLALLGWLAATCGPRLGFPYDLEWMEGGMLAHAWRLRRGLPLYAAPSADWMPFIYPPLYPRLLAWLGEPSYPVGRAVSLLGVLLATGCGVGWLLRSGAGWGPALGAGALVLSGYEDVGAFYDLVRADGLALGLLALAVFMVRVGGTRAEVAGGLCLAAAFAAKQSHAVFGLPLLWWLWRWRGVRPALRFLVASAVPALLWLGWMQLRTGGWFLAWLVEVPAAHPLVGRRAFPLVEKELWGFAPWVLGAAAWVGWRRIGPGSWPGRVAGAAAGLLALGAWCAAGRGGPRGEVGRRLEGWDRALSLRIAGRTGEVEAAWALPLLAVLLLAVAVALVRDRRRLRPDGSLHLGLVATALPLVALMRAHHGGYLNVLMPAIWALPLGAAHLLAGVRPAAWRGLLAAALLAGQAWGGRWERARYLPTDADREAGAAAVDLLRAVDGPVWSPVAPFLAVQAGKAPGPHLIALWDIDHPGGPLRDRVSVVDEALAAHRWRAVLTARRGLGHGLRSAYRVGRRLALPRVAGYPRSGYHIRPELLWVPRE